ncbi:hypothetical protein PMZ80_008216 [Knufia obscura]|uniref:Uncharacterized protein n=1 Tax=Knufia obscura TaxID=1635080 RepID=A0ABR0RIA6_9EURO|nr:hypothetical protein PMZ80_008216 [Knufia obscura]
MSANKNRDRQPQMNISGYNPLSAGQASTTDAGARYSRCGQPPKIKPPTERPPPPKPKDGNDKPPPPPKGPRVPSIPGVD